MENKELKDCPMDPKKKILLVDDEPDILAVNGALLESYGYDIFQAKTGFEALEIINKIVPDLILLDLMIPGVDGYQLCAILKHNKKFRKIPIIILSARYSKTDQEKAKSVGADDYITKPFEPQTLLAKISNLLDKPENKANPIIGQAKSYIGE